MERIEYWVYESEFEMPVPFGGTRAVTVTEQDICRAWDHDEEPAAKYTDLEQALAHYNSISVDTDLFRSSGKPFLKCWTAAIEAYTVEYDEDGDMEDFREADCAIPGTGFRAKAYTIE